MSETKKLPARSEVDPADTWDLASLYAGDDLWEAGLTELAGRQPKYADFRGAVAESPKRLAALLAFDLDTDRLAERLGCYASLRCAEDQADSQSQRMLGRFQSAATKVSEAASFLRPEVMALSEEQAAAYLKAPALAEYRLLLERMLRDKPHTLSEKEEALLAMQGEMAATASQAFRRLLDADLTFGNIRNEAGDTVELTHSSYSELLRSPSREVRRTAFHQYFEGFTSHQYTLAATLNGSNQRDIYYARARNFSSAREAALFADNVPLSVYDNLIATVRRHLPTVHRYLDVRRRKMNLHELRFYDTYVPIQAELEKHHTWDQASDALLAALEPLGSDYCGIMESGLKGRWCDRYPNKHKQSGAFSYGTFDADPYILMNFKPDVLDDVFTLAHEAGHSMHSHYSRSHQPYQYSQYVIFVAEVASTFNEQLLSEYMMRQATDDAERAYFINREIDGIRGTLVRQTMFAEFEKISHELVESGEPLTVDALKDAYRKLLEDYFGPGVAIDDELALECLRIPHFYRAFYVYKYATGLSASIALAERILKGGPQESEDYLGFLKGGCSKWPLELLRDAGVDMERPDAVDTALTRMDRLVGELEELL